MKKPIIYISTRIFVPKKLVDLDTVKRHFEFDYYNEAQCTSCKIYKEGERHSATCDECPAYFGIAKLWQEKTVNGKPYIGLPPGQPSKLEHLLGLDLSQAQDLRPEIPFTHKIKFIQKLYDGSVVDGRQTVNQQQVVKDWLKVKGGIIECPPRAGKTIVSIYIACKLGLKTIVIANKKALLQQFYDTIVGSKIRQPATNAGEIQKTGQTVVKIINKISDFDTDADFVLVNYQKFIRNKKSIARIVKYINNKRSTMIIDECHAIGANSYLKFISRVNCKYRIPLSATPDRKDGRHRLLKAFVGGVVARSTVVAKVPLLQLVETGVHVKNQYKLWVYAMKFLSKNKERNILIVKDVFKDLRDGHHSIIIPVDFVAHGKLLVDMINRQAEINVVKGRDKLKLPIAVFFSSSLKKSPEKMQQILKDVDRGKYRVLVAIRSMIKEGIDLTHPTMLYNIIPCSATRDVGSPLFFQISNRVSTFHVGKRQPIVRLYLDGMGQSVGCMRSLWFLEILKNLKSYPDKPARYLIEQPDYDRIMQIMQERQYIPPNQPGQRVYSKDLVKSSNSTPNKSSSGFSAY